MSSPLLIIENDLWSQGYQLVCGLDEAGRGAWAGPVCAAAVILPQHLSIEGINDSKKLTPEKREKLFDVICQKALAYAISFVSEEVIDEINILQASLKAMESAVNQLSKAPDVLIIDGTFKINSSLPQKTFPKGDGRSQTIGAASILAKVARDRLMRSLEGDFPQFQFSKHKGYGTARHQQELETHGVVRIHRKTFAPIRELTLK